jgi:hypothetical protein
MDLKSYSHMLEIGLKLVNLISDRARLARTNDRGLATDALPPVFSLDQRVHRGCRCHRRQPDPNLGRYRKSDPPWPRFAAERKPRASRRAAPRRGRRRRGFQTQGRRRP